MLEEKPQVCRSIADAGHFQHVGEALKVSGDYRDMEWSYEAGFSCPRTGGMSGKRAILPLLSKDTPKFSFVITCMLETSKQIGLEIGCGNRNDNHRSDDLHVQCIHSSNPLCFNKDEIGCSQCLSSINKSPYGHADLGISSLSTPKVSD